MESFTTNLSVIISDLTDCRNFFFKGNFSRFHGVEN